MSENEKVKILSEVFENLKEVDAKDKSAVLAYIQGTRDTRERINMEQIQIKNS